VAPQQRGKESLLVQVRAAAQHSTAQQVHVAWQEQRCCGDGAVQQSAAAWQSMALLFKSPIGRACLPHAAAPDTSPAAAQAQKSYPVAPGLYCYCTPWWQLHRS
jgi:hypothetical protein